MKMISIKGLIQNVTVDDAKTVITNTYTIDRPCETSSDNSILYFRTTVGWEEHIPG